jgi:hypothetical protein
MAKIEELLDNGREVRRLLGGTPREIDVMVLERTSQVLSTFLGHVRGVAATTAEAFVKATDTARNLHGSSSADSIDRRSLAEAKMWHALNVCFENHARVGLACMPLVITLRILAWGVAAYNVLLSPANPHRERQAILRHAKMLLHQSSAAARTQPDANTEELNKLLLDYWVRRLLNLGDDVRVDLSFIDISNETAAHDLRESQALLPLTSLQAVEQQGLWLPHPATRPRDTFRPLATSVLGPVTAPSMSLGQYFGRGY